QRRNLRAKLHLADRSILDAVRADLKFLESATRGRQADMVDLFQIMILGSKPEDGNAIHAAGSRFVGESHSGKRLVDCEGRSAKQTYLLAGDHRCCTCAQAGDIFSSLG